MLAGLPAFGWAKPVPVNKNRLRNPRFGMMIVAAAGPGTNFVLATIATVIWGLVVGGHPPPQGVAGQLAVTALQFMIVVNVFVGLFNLLPIPPFDGSHIVEGLLPERAAAVYRKLRPYGIGLMFLLLLVIPWAFPQFGIVERLVLPPFEWAVGACQVLADWVTAAIK
jgi:Zn-dependent protease